MYMQYKIPKKLQRYVRMSKSERLIHSPDMPKGLMAIFEETKHNIEKAQTKHREALETMLLKED